MKKNISKVISRVLDTNRVDVFKKLPSFNPGVLAGGTAISLQLVHRHSFDFDIFWPKPLPKNLLDKVQKTFGSQIARIVTNTSSFLDVILGPDIHLHFSHYPYPPMHGLVKIDDVPLFSIYDLASNKAYTLGRRPVWRDYVDLFFILRSGIPIKTIAKEAKQRFGGVFDEKLFLEQLIYFGDIKDFTISYIGTALRPEEIKNFFEKKISLYLKKKLS